ncbi:NAD(P)/FAD-dependent oxidoreductase [Cognatiluteimonas weifangensis]|uniref:NAD(P)/FAD-dependent oxidoreductase n=1 Tax=Cognatiluteimonas weifangensis TaxID=2303539 RepID=A0A372DR03_9GAMM|nr:FAD-dependent oxidoreductase [Luteimonas weifangensis]RFP62001.1 NAD(P)/FAD-dependent oxidoreductase [Luteimonas weifangensis]
MAARITVVGAGFAGLTALRTLRRQAPDAMLTLVAPRAELHYLPGTIWIPSGKRSRADLVVPLDGFLRRERIAFQRARATGLSADARVLRTEAGDVANDGLVIASGARFLRKLPGIEHAIIPCEGVEAGEAIRDRLAALDAGTLCFGFGSNPNEPIAMRGGPVFEFVFGIDTLLRRQRRRDRFRLVFFSPSQKPGQRLGEKAVGMILAEMRKRGIDTVLGEKPQRFEAGAVQLERSRIDSDLTLFMPGLTGQAWLDDTALPRSPGGFVQGDAQCRVPGVACTYVAGDGGSFPGPDWLPKQAHQADLQAAVAARNLLRELRGEPVREAFRSELVCIIDSLDRGLLVTRKDLGGRALPPLRFAHWAKVAFEKRYLRRYR